jgi:two-component system, NtrC family, response regulator HydG
MRVPITERDLTQWLVGESVPTRQLRELILRVAPSELPVWIEGETGVGKEQVAQAMHAASGRRGPFVAVNVCAVADSMFEDAFFGHVRGAFTGAQHETTGYFGEANSGTLFLDEIGGLSIESQVKLLRAVETKRYRQVGAHADQQGAFRVIAASNEALEQMIRRGRFRADLGYRLRGIVVRVPALRDRREDIDQLAAHFLSAGDPSQVPHLASSALEWLRTQHWAGNVREVRQLLLCAQQLVQGLAVGVAALRAAREMIAPDELSPTEPIELGQLVSRERDELITLLDEHGWNTLKVAEVLAVDRTTVYRRMRRLAIRAPRTSSANGTSALAPNGRQLGANGAPPSA